MAINTLHSMPWQMVHGAVYSRQWQIRKIKRQLQKQSRRSGAEPPDAGGYTHFHKIFMAVLARSPRQSDSRIHN